jgi:hypothetical protein
VAKQAQQRKWISELAVSTLEDRNIEIIASVQNKIDAMGWDTAMVHYKTQSLFNRNLRSRKWKLKSKWYPGSKTEKPLCRYTRRCVSRDYLDWANVGREFDASICVTFFAKCGVPCAKVTYFKACPLA